MHLNRSMLASIAVLVFIAAFTLPALRTFFDRRKSKDYDQAPNATYEDTDGIATEESQNSFTDFIPKCCIYVLTIIGAAASLTQPLLSLFVKRRVETDGVFVTELWLQFASWTLLLVQCLSLSVERNSCSRYTTGIYGSISSLLLAVSTLAGLLPLYLREEGGPEQSVVIFAALKCTTALLLMVANSSLPRRPEVTYNGGIVDRQFTVSALNLSTFAWCEPLLKLAAKKRSLDLTDVPKLNHMTRAEYLSKDHQRATLQLSTQKKLWKQLISNFAGKFVLQWVLTLIASLINFAPQYAMFRILRLLEQRQTGQDIMFEATIWVFGLGTVKMMSTWLDSWMFWVGWCDLALPIRTQLATLVFEKAMRRKDVKGVQKTKSKDPGDGEAISNGVTDAAKDDDKKEEQEEDIVSKTRQSTINLVGVDGKRVAEFACYNMYFGNTAFNLVIALTFLVKLLGWRSLVSGLLVTVVMTPMNAFYAKRYKAAQDRLMKVRDQKMVVVTEALQGIRQIKFGALEEQWHGKIRGVRSKELTEQWNVFKWETYLLLCWLGAPIMLSAVALTTYALLYNELEPSIAFTSLSLFGALEIALSVIPELITESLDAVVSVNRIDEFLNSPERITNTVASPTVSFEKADIAWPCDEPDEEEDRFVLRNVNIEFPDKELSVISGDTGSGKSLLLASIIGEAEVLGGIVRVPKGPALNDRFDHKATPDNWIIPESIAYVAQIPWIENASIKDNILFGLPFIPSRYQNVLSSCALIKDLEIFPDGESTEIGANGINLSGGQKWRLSFARALYSRAGLLVLDDIFSAVDTHVGKQLFEQALTGPLGRNRTRILVTHHVQLTLPRTKFTVHLGDGTVQHAGFVEDLKRSGSLQDILTREASHLQEEEAEANDQANGPEAIDDDDAKSTKSKSGPKKFVEDEGKEQGSVKLALYLEYFQKSGGLRYWIIVMIAFAGSEALLLSRGWWVKIWSGSYKTSSATHYQPRNQQHFIYANQISLNSASSGHDIGYYLAIYMGLSVAACLVGTFKYWWVFVCSIKASRELFERLSHTVLRAPLRFLDTTPVGRILNRFTADFNVVDSKMAMDLGFLAYNILQIVGIMIAGLIVSPYVILFSVALLLVCSRFAVYYLGAARELRRLESNSKSPIFEQFNSALMGLQTIRAFDKAETYVKRMFLKIDDHTATGWANWLANRWLGFRLGLIGAVFVTLVAYIIVRTEDIDAALGGFALAFAMDYSISILWLIRRYASTELNMNATERIVEYSTMPVEDQFGLDVPAAWPSEGKLIVDNLVVGYAPDLPPVLKGLSFEIEKNQRVGVVGRTGAGKSSLTLALFRFLEAREGSVRIDGIDISKIKLHDLRSRLAIIPQDPVLFSGTVRSNLDGFDEHTDSELRDALERVHLTRATGLASRDEQADSASGEGPSATPSTINENVNIFNSLSSKISEGGLNLSQGQRQLLCLARAIVSRPKIMVLDEATSAVDMGTDALIQRSIREEFGDATLIVIAHRLSTIADFDKILVMSEGKAVEFDSPKDLMNKGGVFAEMVHQSGERKKLEQIILGAGLSRGSTLVDDTHS